MNTVLFIKSSVLGEHSETNRMLEALRARWRETHPEARQLVRDLGAEPLPHLRGEHLSQRPTEADAALAELKAADVVVLAAPMYNFGVPSTLKAWFDHVLRAGETFRYTETGPQGLLVGKRAVVLMSTGGVYEGSPHPADFVEPYLRTVLGFIGITDVEVHRLSGAALPQDLEARRAQVHAALRAR